jgi:glucuronoarabinoxylan endo-1,4-beta-xylanase
MSGDLSVTLSSLEQTISGFGASTAWGSGFTNASDPDTLWSTTTGAGLSLHRIHIDDADDSTSEVSIAQKAVSYGVTVWATPWTPPAVDKSNDSTVEGTLTNPSAFATYLTGFVANMKKAAVDIYAVSSQNEPDANVTYESCAYTGTTLASFVGSYMGPAFAGSSIKVMTPETQNWCDFPSFLSALEANTAAWNATDIVATHEYGCSPAAYPAIQAAGKEFWETEIYDENTYASNADTDGMPSGLWVAAEIHNALTVANMNAWHYWWVYGSGTGGLYDTSTNVWTKRLWVEGNFARFVRPGYQRVSTSGGPSNVLLTAYTNASNGTVVIVAINNNTSSTPLSVFVSGAAPCSFTPWVTSSSDSLASQTPVTVSKSRFTTTLAAQSVTTFVGTP